jgi:hypothetical protein
MRAVPVRRIERRVRSEVDQRRAKAEMIGRGRGDGLAGAGSGI